MRTRAIWVGMLGSLVLVACGDGGSSGTTTTTTTTATTGGTSSTPSGPVHQRGTDAATAVLGGSGGTFELSNGARLELGPGAVPSGTEVTFAIGADTQAFDNREDQRAIGPTVQVSPAFSAAPGARVTLSVPFHGMPSGFSSEDLAIAVEVVDEEQRAMQMGGVQTRWEFLRATTQGDRISAELADVTGLRLQFVAAR